MFSASFRLFVCFGLRFVCLFCSFRFVLVRVCLVRLVLLGFCVCCVVLFVCAFCVCVSFVWFARFVLCCFVFVWFV